MRCLLCRRCCINSRRDWIIRDVLESPAGRRGRACGCMATPTDNKQEGQDATNSKAAALLRCALLCMHTLTRTQESARQRNRGQQQAERPVIIRKSSRSSCNTKANPLCNPRTHTRLRVKTPDSLRPSHQRVSCARPAKKTTPEVELGRRQRLLCPGWKLSRNSPPA